MTQQQFNDAFVSWAAVHGVTAKPENDEQWDASPANTPPAVQMTYTAPNLAKLRLPADVMLWEMGDTEDAADDGRMAGWLKQVLTFYGLAPEVKVAWREFLHPTPKVPDTIASGPIGAEVPRESVATQSTLGGRIDGSKRYFYPTGSVTDGQRLNDGGRLYIAVKPGPFAIWWMLVG